MCLEADRDLHGTNPSGQSTRTLQSPDSASNPDTPFRRPGIRPVRRNRRASGNEQMPPPGVPAAADKVPVDRCKLDGRSGRQPVDDSMDVLWTEVVTSRRRQRDRSAAVVRHRALPLRDSGRKTRPPTNNARPTTRCASSPAQMGNRQPASPTLTYHGDQALPRFVHAAPPADSHDWIDSFGPKGSLIARSRLQATARQLSSLPPIKMFPANIPAPRPQQDCDVSRVPRPAPYWGDGVNTWHRLPEFRHRAGSLWKLSKNPRAGDPALPDKGHATTPQATCATKNKNLRRLSRASPL